MAGRIAIVGGGPAGLIAAETLADAGAQVAVFEQMRSAGRKFLLAGRGGLNITHTEPTEELLDRYGAARPYLAPAIQAFGPEQLRQWSAGHNEVTFVGSSGRVFPQSFRATPLLRSWLRRLDDRGVTLATQHRWTGWDGAGSLEFDTVDGPRTIAADAVIFALGGASWPRVGSDGAWAPLFVAAGIEVTALAPANTAVHVAWSTVLQERFAGTPIKNTVFSVGDQRVRGDAVVSEAGLEGGPIYALGPSLRSELATNGSATLHLDLHPDLDLGRLTQRLSKRRPKSSLSSWLSSAQISPVAVALARETTANRLPEDPAALAALLKDLPLPVASLASLDRAISTAGGISWAALNSQYMLEQRPGTFIAGEMLDWEAPTGGYLLQACFSTGVAAAQGVLEHLG